MSLVNTMSGQYNVWAGRNLELSALIVNKKTISLTTYRMPINSTWRLCIYKFIYT